MESFARKLIILLFGITICNLTYGQTTTLLLIPIENVEEKQQNDFVKFIQKDLKTTLTIASQDWSKILNSKWDKEILKNDTRSIDQLMIDYKGKTVHILGSNEKILNLVRQFVYDESFLFPKKFTENSLIKITLDEGNIDFLYPEIRSLDFIKTK